MIFFLFFFLVLFSYNEVVRGNLSLKIFYLLILIVSTIEGIRWYSGVDFYMYYNSYNKVLENVTELQNKRYDFFYLLLTKCFKTLNLHYTFFLIAISFFSGMLYLLSIRKLTSYPVFALLFLFVNIIGFWGNNRQLIALSIVFYAAYYLIEKKYKYAIALILIASGFHFTAITMLVLFFFTLQINKKAWLLITLLVLIISFLPIESILLKVLQINKSSFHFWYVKVKSYSKIDAFDFNWFQFCLGFLKKIIPIIILIKFKETFSEFKGYRFFLNVSIASVLVYIFANFNMTYLLGRYTIYFSIYECIIYSWLGHLIFNHKHKTIIFLVFVFFSGIVLLKSISLYAHLFTPYNTIFNNL